MTGPRREARSLRPEAEAAWDELRAGLELHDGFWLAFVLGAQQSEVDEYVARCADLARARARRVDVVASDPVDKALAALVDPTDGLYATWLRDSGGPGRGAAWGELLRRLNERRDVLRVARPAAVVVCLRAGEEGLVRDSAPDLWSYRTLTTTVPVSPRPGARTSTVPGSSLGSPVGRPSETWGVAGASVVASASIARLLLDSDQALLAGRVAIALSRAKQAVEEAVTLDDVALSRAALAQARRAQDEPLEAQREAQLALRAGRPLGGRITAALLTILAGADDWQVALPSGRALVRLRRAELAEYPEAPDLQRLLSIALERVADSLWAQGRLEDALNDHTESLTLARRIHITTGDTPETLRDLSIALEKVADIHRDQGRLDDALTEYNEALTLRRRIHTTTGDTPQALRDLSVSLNHVADIHRDQGRLDDALTGSTEALTLRRRIHTTTGDTPQALRDLSVSLNRVADIHRDQGRLDDALTEYNEALTLARRIYITTGDTPETLRDLSVSLNRVADIHRDQGRLDDALTGHTEALTLRRRIHTTTGDTPQALRGLVVSLTNVANIHRDQGRLDDALTGHTEALTLRRRIHTTTGDTPQALRGLGISLDRVANINYAQGRLDDALTGYTEALTLARRIHTTTGDTPEALHDLVVSLDNVAHIEEQLGENARARPRYLEAIDLNDRLRDRYGDPYWDDTEVAALRERMAQPGDA